MDTSLLLTDDPKALAQHLRDAAQRLGTAQVTRDLLTKVDSESLPPRIFNFWLSAGGDCEAIREGIRFQPSKSVRRASIAHFGRLFRSVRVNDVWNAIGGTTGIIDHLAEASVCDVKSFCNQICRSGTAKISTESREALVDQLYRKLRDAATNQAVSNTPDQRPLSTLYDSMFSACSQNLILSVIDCKSGIEDVAPGESAFFARPAIFRSRFISELHDQSVEVDMERLRALLKIGSNDRSSLNDSRLTANTQFALEVLEALSARTKLEGDANAMLSDIATPLFRRLTRRKCLPETIARATLAYVNFVQQHISNRLSFRRLLNIPGKTLIEAWGRCSKRLEDSLTIYLRLAPNPHLVRPSEWLDMVRYVPSILRLRLLGMASRCDLGTRRGLEESKLQWDSFLLLALPPAEARPILEQLIEIGAGRLNESYPAESRQAEISLLRIKLSKYEPIILELASAAVDDRKKQASRAREQPWRASCISSALQIAAASQCLQLYRDTLLWTRKYIKDPLTAMEVFQGPTFTSEEYLDLLCGFPKIRDECALVTQEQVASDVRQANVIIIECCQTACQAQQEPGFKSYHWSAVLGMMSAIVGHRYERVNVLQDTLQLSDGETFDIVWRDTIETCMALERLGLEEDNTSLDFNWLGGPLMKRTSILPALVDPRPATLRFIDTLAESRNAFWEDFRRKHAPATMALVEPYPRGLPLECLLPVDLDQCKVKPHLPYIFSRAERVVFVSADVALAPQPVIVEHTDAIGVFVENWKGALRTYVYLSGNRLEAALSAWEHATGPLSTTRMSGLEAHLFWSKEFCNSLEYTDIHVPWEQKPAGPPSPVIPAVDDDGESPIEWAPEASVEAFEVLTPRRLERVRIDAMLCAERTVDRTIDILYNSENHSEVPRHVLPPFWARWQNPHGAAPTVREALIAAAMLHTSESHSISPGILSQPYPSKSDVRFPSLYLDGDFLEKKNPKWCHHYVWHAMRRLCNDIPANLSLRLTRSLVGKNQTPTHAFELLRVLIRGDRPQVALDLIKEVILDRPDDSSWQRLILTKGLLNVLPKPNVESFLRDLSDAIQARLAAPISSRDDTTTENAPRIKITTVKLLSQLLSGAMFVDDTFASSVLIGILASTRHIDIRVSVLESLVDILAHSKNAIICGIIIDAFEAHLVPVMSGMNERVPMSEDEWMACDAENLPELYELASGDLPPILSCMVSSVAKVNETMREQLFERIIIPTLLESCKRNARWMHLYAESHSLTVPNKLLPKAPVHLQFLVELMRWPAYIPAFVVDLWTQVLATMLNPPSVVVELNENILKDSKIRNSENGGHWLKLCGPNARTILLNRTKPASMLREEWNSVRQDGLSIRHIQQSVLHQFKLMLPLCHPTIGNDPWKQFMDDLRPPAWDSDKFGLWHRNVKPLIQQCKDHVDELRTPEWQRNPDRSPIILPDTFEWRLWLVTPALKSEDSRDDDLKLFASSVTNLLVELGRSQRSYIKRYETLVSFIRAKGNTVDLAKLAIIFGNLDNVDCEKLDTVQDLKIDLARQLLEAGRDIPSPGEELRGRVRTMIDSLIQCFDEDVRGVGLKLLQDTGWPNGICDNAWYAKIKNDGT